MCLNRKVTGLENIVEKIEKQMKKKADTERHKLIKEMSVDTDEPQTKVKVNSKPRIFFLIFNPQESFY